jgi:2-polyprenyl-3-methyl-5-hydroxy-6-metoxy-1,4-benzoquinol methylase
MDAAGRRAWFESLRARIAGSYLAEPANPFRQSGRSGGAARWVETRRCIADAVRSSGDFMDVGCANGLLLETLIQWCAGRGHRLRPHGIDLLPELVELARRRHPDHADSFAPANVLYWLPRRRYDYVRTNLEYVPPDDRAESVIRLYELAVESSGRLIVCHYRNADESPVDVPGFLAGLGLAVAGESSAPGVSLAWTDRAA